MIPVIGLIIGLLVGIFVPYKIPAEYTVYIVVGILAVTDSVFGAAAANLRGRFDMKLFWSGILGNTALAMLLTFVGDKFGAQLYLAAVFAFGNRIFTNFAIIRRMLFLRRQEDRPDLLDKTSEKQDAVKETEY